MNYYLLAMFVLVCLFHICTILAGQKNLEYISKLFIVPVILTFYCVCTEETDWPVVTALIFAFLGDAVLLSRSTRMLATGGVLFGISHLLYIYYIITNLIKSDPNYWTFMFAALFIVLALIISQKISLFIPKTLKAPATTYIIAICITASLLLIKMINNFTVVSIVAFLGGLLFILSDTLLFYGRFYKKSQQKSNIYIMLTYMLAQFLIILGFTF